MSTFSTEVFDNEVLSSSLGSIAPILSIATEHESQRARVAYLFRYYAFEIAHRLDQRSSGRGVRQFKMALLQRLQTLRALLTLLIITFHRVAQLGKAYQTAVALFEVLCCVNKYEKVEEVAPEIIAAARDVEEKKEICAPYNILPLDAAVSSQPIMQCEEVKAAVAALWNTCGLNWPGAFEPQRQKAGDLDTLDWLRAMFGFQRDNVRNQRGHLILLLANNHTRLHPKPEPHNKKVITPISHVIDKEAKKNKDGKASNTDRCNYDDLNEYFCFAICLSDHLIASLLFVPCVMLVTFSNQPVRNQPDSASSEVWSRAGCFISSVADSQVRNVAGVQSWLAPPNLNVDAAFVCASTGRAGSLMSQNQKRKYSIQFEQESMMDSDGVSWLRGPILGKGAFGSVFLATSRNPKSRFFPPTMAVKSAEFSASASLQKEKEILNNLLGLDDQEFEVAEDGTSEESSSSYAADSEFSSDCCYSSFRSEEEADYTVEDDDGLFQASKSPKMHRPSVIAIPADA
ncbi:hypothetical protein QYF36_016035 [Acer negundo]|nr:hypothetical protein QYF36_016035 [Acer negundo]